MVSSFANKSTNKPRRICVLAYDGLCTFEYSLAVEIFALSRPEHENWYDFGVVAVDEGPIRGLGNITVEADTDLSGLLEADLIIIPGWRGADEQIPQALRDTLIEAHKNGTRIASICSGVFVLAQCGLLDGADATTHWRYVDKLRDMYPLIKINPDVLYVDNGLILTSAGSAAGFDLCLHIVRQDYGTAAANAVARRLVVPAHRDGGQSQFISRPLPLAYQGNIAPLLDKIRESLDEDWEIERMANEAHTSARTLQRRFKNATGKSPHTWLTMERVELAKDLLETTHLNIQQIADVTGLKTPETFRHHFKRITGASPTKFRSKFNPVIREQAAE